MYRFFVKRTLDLTIAIFGFMIILPFFLLITFLLFLFNRGKVFFTQERPGKNGKTFYIVKFKTMNDQCDLDGKLLPDHIRLTPFGRFVRTTSMDEIPQLLNVIKGNMSFVGPRPLLVKYLPLYNERQSRRHEVRPGITGWAQVNGRNAISWQEKFELDVWYVENISFSVDIKILWITILKVFKSEGINQPGHVTMNGFKGNETFEIEETEI